jgi:predicted nucleotidyltransferase
MSAEITLNLINNYKLTLNDLKERLVKELGDELDSLVLYGSVARGDYGRESDIDILVILEDHYNHTRSQSRKCFHYGWNYCRCWPDY